MRSVAYPGEQCLLRLRRTVCAETALHASNIQPREPGPLHGLDRQRHERDPIKVHTRVALDDNAPFADVGHSAHKVDFVTQPRRSSSLVRT